MKSLAIMQPYFFPYIGYWQLIHAVDKFVVYDDVNYINRGWVNRNRILINGQPSYITMPLIQASQNKLICDISIQAPELWQPKLLRSIENAYRKTPYFNEVFPLIENMVHFESENLASYLVNHLQSLAKFMGITTEFVTSSRVYANKGLERQDRILDICQRENVTHYINSQGGQALYETASFLERGLDLKFIIMKPIAYPQKAEKFEPYLSIIDALMEVGPHVIKAHLDAYDLIQGSPSHTNQI